MTVLRARYSKIRREVESLLARAGVRKPPVPVEQVAHMLGAQVLYSTFEGKVSGVLIRHGSAAVIGVNESHPSVRQRFTIAHEIGHLVLHEAGDKSVHIDTQFRMHFRSAGSSTAEDLTEIEANAFAAELLMPSNWILNAAVRSTFDIDDESSIKPLADRFQVSTQAMTFRLLNVLGLRQSEPN